MPHSPEGHSRAWWSPYWTKAGLPSLAQTFLAISSPSIGWPRSVSPIERSRTKDG